MYLPECLCSQVRFTNNAQPLVLRLPVRVMVASLPSASAWLGYLGSTPLYPDTVWPDVNARAVKDLKPSLQLLRDAGNTAASGGNTSDTRNLQSHLCIINLCLKRVVSCDHHLIFECLNSNTPLYEARTQCIQFATCNAYHSLPELIHARGTYTQSVLFHFFF